MIQNTPSPVLRPVYAAGCSLLLALGTLLPAGCKPSTPVGAAVVSAPVDAVVADTAARSPASVSALANAATAATGPATAFAPELIEQALNTPAPVWRYEYTKRSHRINEAFALYTLCLEAFLQQESDQPADPRIITDVVEKFEYVMGGGREPESQGGLGGWSHGAFAWALALARHTDSLWNAFDSDTQEKADLLMEAMAVAAVFCFDDGNDYWTMVDGDRNFKKRMNPNHVEGYVGVGMAAAWYFGPGGLDARLAVFDFDSFVVRLQQAQFSNIVACWTRIPGTRTAMMEGGPFLGEDSYHDYGSGAGVRGNAFTYGGVSPEDAWGVYRQLATRLFNHTVVTQIPVSGKPGLYTHIMQRDAQGNYLISPYEGQFGMCHEFDSTNALTNGSRFRSSLFYVYEGWMNNMASATVIRARGLWLPQGEADEAMSSAIYVGSSDFLYKAQHGYFGFANGKEQTGDAAALARVTGGWNFATAWWAQIVRPAVSEPESGTAD